MVNKYTLYRSRTVRQLTKYTVARKGSDSDNKADVGQTGNQYTSGTSTVSHSLTVIPLLLNLILRFLFLWLIMIWRLKLLWICVCTGSLWILFLPPSTDMHSRLNSYPKVLMKVWIDKMVIVGMFIHSFSSTNINCSSVHFLCNLQCGVTTKPQLVTF